MSLPFIWFIISLFNFWEIIFQNSKMYIYFLFLFWKHLNVNIYFSRRHVWWMFPKISSIKNIIVFMKTILDILINLFAHFRRWKNGGNIMNVSVRKMKWMHLTNATESKGWSDAKVKHSNKRILLTKDRWLLYLYMTPQHTN